MLMLLIFSDTTHMTFNGKFNSSFGMIVFFSKNLNQNLLRIHLL